MHLMKILMLLTFSVSAFAEEGCYLSFWQARPLLFKLDSAKKLRTNPAQPFDCSSFRTRENPQIDGGRNLSIEGFCGGSYKIIDIGTTQYSTDGLTYERLDSKFLCRVDYRRPLEKKQNGIQNLGLLERITPTCSLRDRSNTDCYHPRLRPVLKAAMIYYGTFWKESDIIRFKDAYVERFNQAAQGEIEIKVVKTKALPFRELLPVSFTLNGITDQERLQRLYYWAQIGKDLREELFWEYFSTEDDKSKLEDIDVLLTVTGAQEDGNGYAGARVVVVEQPREIAWMGADKGSTQTLSDDELADIMVHETGHFLGLGHAAEQCDSDNVDVKKYPGDRLSRPMLSPEEQCCADSANKDDVMSYCRNRASKKVNLFRSCSLEYLKKNVVPRMLNGESKKIADVYDCK